MFHRQPQDDVVANADEKKQSESNKVEVTGKEEVEMPDTQGKDKTIEDSVSETVQNEAMPSSVPGGVSFQKPMVSRTPGNFPGSYGASIAAGTSSVASSTNVSDDSRLIIGRGITMSGEIESCDTLIVEGTVEAALKGAKILDIAESGVFYGTVEIEEAVISGRFEGDIMVNGRLTVTSTGSVTGSVAYGELAIEAGATVDGRIAPLSAAMMTERAVPAGKSLKSQGAKNDNAGAELPFAGSSVAAE